MTLVLIISVSSASCWAGSWFTDCIGTWNCAPGAGSCPVGFGPCIGTAPAGTRCDGWAMRECSTAGGVGVITAECKGGVCTVGGAPCSLPAFAGACYKK